MLASPQDAILQPPVFSELYQHHVTGMNLLSYGIADWVKLLGVSLILATILNGTPFFLKKVGIVNKEAYEAYWNVHSVGGPYSCGPLPRKQFLKEKAYTRYLFENKGGGIFLKGMKDLLIGGFILLSFILHLARKDKKSNRSLAWPVLSLVLLVVAASLLTYLKHGGLLVASGIRSFMFLGIASAGMWFVRSKGLGILAACTGILILVQFLIIPFELIFGLPINGYLCFLNRFLPARVSGTFILPNSLGSFAISALAFYYDFSNSRKYLRWLIPITLLLVIASGSATGFICFVLFLGILLIRHLGENHQKLAYTAVTALLMSVLILLPYLLGRPALLGSLFGERGRFKTLQAVIASNSPYETIFGNGIGYGTNTALTLFQQNYTHKAVFGYGAALLRPDSTITMMFCQVGVIGLILFYAMLFLAMLRDNKARIFYLTIILTSMTMSITELFPVNFLLGVALASSFSTDCTAKEPIRHCQAA
ncbi:MAG TPA: hypothetical protein VEI46_04555 [Thermodesulfovibrionales bacterium]|nr:hypothetical protein [Thermodesulfovibrionales bacterium]